MKRWLLALLLIPPGCFSAGGADFDRAVRDVPVVVLNHGYSRVTFYAASGEGIGKTRMGSCEAMTRCRLRMPPSVVAGSRSAGSVWVGYRGLGDSRGRWRRVFRIMWAEGGYQVTVSAADEISSIRPFQET